MMLESVSRSNINQRWLLGPWPARHAVGFLRRTFQGFAFQEVLLGLTSPFSSRVRLALKVVRESQVVQLSAPLNIRC